ncbi:MAG: cyclic pyranopterin monophosphate synthase MoaC [Nitrospinota bacterium]|nr:cyclic pyranopterin monophosphate synthase MoaC [Nitrospinota bacterium]MDP6279422.1 cyclic pyranopterin monophosphate synthase MoaC [Nitrospinota bacterium]MDP6366340.1 cyclic pyranopterin monophosphate synthase MoaC [Nitrospinota bacterium]MDP7371644.1 cyclic pyranopterin monophosphate synthase MoaC [Nitrospinota bacterium]MDP7504981.1 cyclic pyranopterin monophosphate synthase MoaC [Nitrospinota bacterium]
MAQELTHLDDKGRARMVEVGEKPETAREAIARGRVEMEPGTLRLILEGGLPKGDVLGTARIAGVMAAKGCSGLIPMCHPLRLTSVEVNFEPAEEKGSLEVEAVVRARDRTGVEMEALAAVSVAALTVYDMCKAVDKEMTISAVRLVRKTGGKSGTFIRAGE